LELPELSLWLGPIFEVSFPDASLIMLEFKATPVDSIQLAMVIIDHPVPKGYAASPRLIQQPLK
jgi:hypothetical protein